ELPEVDEVGDRDKLRKIGADADTPSAPAESDELAGRPGPGGADGPSPGWQGRGGAGAGPEGAGPSGPSEAGRAGAGPAGAAAGAGGAGQAPGGFNPQAIVD